MKNLKILKYGSRGSREPPSRKTFQILEKKVGIQKIYIYIYIYEYEIDKKKIKIEKNISESRKIFRIEKYFVTRIEKNFS